MPTVRRGTRPARAPGGNRCGPPPTDAAGRGGPGGSPRRGPPRRRPPRRPAGPDRLSGRGQGQDEGEVGGRLGHADARRPPRRRRRCARAPARRAARARPGAEPGGPSSTPWADRRGGADAAEGARRAWISTSRARWPSMAGSTALPGVPGRRSPSRRVWGSVTAARPASPMAKSPSSPVGPKRCLVARTMRSAWCRSPSTVITVSTRCSSTRGPARAPSLVTWPDQHHRHPVGSWPAAPGTRRRPATWATLPGQARRRRDRPPPGSSRRRPGRVDLLHAPGHGPDVGGLEEQQGRGHRPQAFGPQPDLGGRLLGRHQHHRRPR